VLPWFLNPVKEPIELCTSTKQVLAVSKAQIDVPRLCSVFHSSVAAVLQQLSPASSSHPPHEIRCGSSSEARPRPAERLQRGGWGSTATGAVVEILKHISYRTDSPSSSSSERGSNSLWQRAADNKSIQTNLDLL